MTYLITKLNDTPFLTTWFDHRKHEFDIVYNLKDNTYSIDGYMWCDIEVDTLCV